MSENVTHTAILDDCFRLMAASDTICDAFKDVAQTQNDFARLGGITRWGDRFTVQLLASYRDRWPNRTEEDRIEPKLAFVLGWLAHRAADRQMKPVFREADPHRTVSPSECSVYHDAFVFREVFALGEESPYSVATFDRDMGALPGAAGLDVPQVEAFFRALLQRALIEMHTFIPDADDIEGWLDRVSGLQQRFYVDLERYARAITDPEPDKVKRFLSDTCFYDRDDAIILTARALQRGDKVRGSDVSLAVASDAVSQYGQALQMGVGYLQSASDFFTGEGTPETLAEQLNIGKKGRDGQSV